MSVIEPSESLWTVADVAAYVRCSKSLIYKLAERGELPSLRIGALLRFEPGAVRAWARGAPAPTASVTVLSARRRY